MRGSTTVGPLSDGESIESGGVTYQLTQTVTNRAESTYQNVLTINQPLADIVGSSFTCRVQNTVGTSPTSDSLQIIGEFVPHKSHHIVFVPLTERISINIRVCREGAVTFSTSDRN